MVKVSFKTPDISMTKYGKALSMCDEYNLVQAIAALVTAYDASSKNPYKIRNNLIEALKND